MKLQVVSFFRTRNIKCYLLLIKFVFRLNYSLEKIRFLQLCQILFGGKNNSQDFNIRETLL